MEYNRQIASKWQISGNFSHLQKRYADDDLAKFYDGHANSTAWILLYQPQPKWLVYGGADFTRDDLADQAETSDRKGIRAGMAYSGNQVNIRSSIRYAQRDFEADNFLYGEKREDDEYQFSTTVGHKLLNWRGFVPKLNYAYQRIDSNLPLYERSNSTFFVEVDKKF